jgi:hypothetical protein
MGLNGPERHLPDARITTGSRMVERITGSVLPSIDTSAGPPLRRANATELELVEQ